MNVSARRTRFGLPHRFRGVLALLVLTIYLVGGVLHGLFDLDVTTGSTGAGVVISLAKSDVGHSESGGTADHHCHGCFSVSLPAPAVGAGEEMPTAKVMSALDAGHRGLSPGIDLPPPKILT